MSATFAFSVPLFPVEMGEPVQFVFALLGRVQLMKPMVVAVEALTTKFAEVPVNPASEAGDVTVSFNDVLVDAL